VIKYIDAFQEGNSYWFALIDTYSIYIDVVEFQKDKTVKPTGVSFFETI
jgi:hypothetical protein